jgi:purine nucleoside permease
MKGTFILARTIVMAFLLAPAAARVAADPIPVKVAVVVTFEIGADRGDTPGEFQNWVEGENWTKSIVVPGVDHPVLTDGNGTIGVVAGTTVRASNTIMALVMSGMFDFSKTYWVINGIAGVNPHLASIGSAAWAKYVIDGDVAYEVDSREAAAAWPYGIIPLGSNVPNQMPKGHDWPYFTMAFPLNPSLVQWAYSMTKATALPDTDAMRKARADFVGMPNAQRPPFVLIGDSFCSCRFWYGSVMNQWAEDWTKLWSQGKAEFVMSAMEDQGFATALTKLSKMGKVDFQRVLVLRTGSDYCTPAPGRLAKDGINADYPGFVPALQSAYRVGSQVSHEIAAHWDQYRDKIPVAN